MNIRAYGVWVSEIMLQQASVSETPANRAQFHVCPILQTQVVTVVDYYRKWMKVQGDFCSVELCYNLTLIEVAYS